jgi:hypothetical protein
MRKSNKRIVNSLFKTHDGVTMHIGMDVWYIEGERDNILGLKIKSVKVQAVGNHSWSNANGGGNGLPPYARKNDLVFSTKEKALDWLIEHLEKAVSQFKLLKGVTKTKKQTQKSADEIVNDFAKTEDGVHMYPGMTVYLLYKENPLFIRESRVDQVSKDGYLSSILQFANRDKAQERQRELVDKFVG